jgi:hypothetical protein
VSLVVLLVLSLSSSSSSPRRLLSTTESPYLTDIIHQRQQHSVKDNDNSGTINSLRETINQLAAANAAFTAREDATSKPVPLASSLTPSSSVSSAPSSSSSSSIAVSSPSARAACDNDNGITPFTIFVLTYNRPQSLERLLSSLRAAHYDNDCIALTISVDYPKSGSTPEHQQVIQVAQQALWHLGPKHVQV